MDSDADLSLIRGPTVVEGLTIEEAHSSGDEAVRSLSSSLKPVLSFQIPSSDDETTIVGDAKRKPRRRRPPPKAGGKRGGPSNGPRRVETGVKPIELLLRGPNVPGPCSYCNRANVAHYRKPYHDYIRRLTIQGWPYLKRLDTFMNFAEHTNKRSLPVEVKQRWRSKLRLTVLDYCDTGVINGESFTNTIYLRDFLALERPEQVKGRLFVLEDLSRDAIEYLGGALNVEPDFWEGHISGSAKLTGPNYVYGPYNTRVKYPPRLLSKQKRHGHFRLDFVKFRLNTEKEDPIAVQANEFNIKRHSDIVNEAIRNLPLGTDQVRQQIWTDQRVSVLILPFGADGWTGIIIFDPSFADSQDPSPWKSRSFAEYPSFHEQQSIHKVFSNGRSDYEDFIALQLSESKHPSATSHAIEDSYYAVHELFLLIASQWTTASSQIWVQLATLEERIQKNVDSDLEQVLSVHVKDLLAWQTQVESYYLMVMLAIRQLKSGGHRDGWKRADHTSDTRNLVQQLEQDIVEEYGRLLFELKAFKERIERNLALFNASLSIEESKKAIKESESVSRLTKLAFVFIPLSYIASLLSIQGPGAPGSGSFWLYWAVALPLTLLTFFAAAIVNWLFVTVGPYFQLTYWREKSQSKKTHLKRKKKGLKEWFMLHAPWIKEREPQLVLEEGSMKRQVTATESVFTRTTDGDYDEDKRH